MKLVTNCRATPLRQNRDSCPTPAARAARLLYCSQATSEDMTYIKRKRTNCCPRPTVLLVIHFTSNILWNTFTITTRQNQEDEKLQQMADGYGDEDDGPGSQ